MAAWDAVLEGQDASTIRLNPGSLVVLAGPSGSGKSTWASAWFGESHVVSSDQLRAVVGQHEHDLRASDDAFAVLDEIVTRRISRGLVTVVDTLGMDRDRLDRWIAIAADHRRTTHLVRFDVEPATCRRRNKARTSPVPAKVMTAQLTKWTEVFDQVADGFDHVHEPGPALIVNEALVPRAGESTRRSLRFGLSISAFDWAGDAEGIADRLAAIAGEAEHAGFDSIWVMDHFMQIPQVGREWDPMLEPYTALAFLAARTERVSLGALVSCITHRNIGLLGKTIATLDVVSGGRARCGLGVGWYEREHRAYGYDFPTVAQRYELLQDALDYLPLLWGPGAPKFEGRTFSTPEAIGYPRPLQEHVPILIGGSGEERTLRLAAAHADACNLFGEPDVVAHKVAVLRNHCADLGRDPNEVEVTQLSAILCAPSPQALRSRVDDLRGNRPADDYAVATKAATASEHVDRFGRLVDAGVEHAIVSLADVGFEGAVADFASVIAAFD